MLFSGWRGAPRIALRCRYFILPYELTITLNFVSFRSPLTTKDGFAGDSTHNDRREAGNALHSVHFQNNIFKVSKPIAEALINYGKNHPLFRNRVLIPVGRSLVHLTTRLRMKKLGLGSPTTVATVSEATALEQVHFYSQTRHLAILNTAIDVFMSANIIIYLYQY